MQINQIQIKNLRCLTDAKLKTDSLTALIGGNNVGKSTILRPIELFFEAAPKVTKDDFSGGDTTQPIEVTIEFGRLTPLEIEEFGTAVVNGSLIVSRHWSLSDPESGQYSVQALTFDGFADVRAETNGTKRRSLYSALQKSVDGLETVASHTEIDAAFAKWEKAHPDKLAPNRIRGFFGAPNVANGKLKKKTAVHLVPAVRDASVDASDKRSPLIALLADIAKQTFENRKDTAAFLLRAQQEFAAISDPANVPELAEINYLLTKSVQRFYADSKLSARWEQGNGVQLSFPSPKLEIEHNGVSGDLSRVGHGLQRAALFAIVQFLAERRAENETEGVDADKEFVEAASDIILLVEEPEIYQHPSKQLVIYEAFKRIVQSHSSATGIRIQVIYTTHSEKFIRMSEFEIARIVRRVQVDGIPTISISDLDIQTCSTLLATLHDPPRPPMSREAFAAKLHIFTREICEAFFAAQIILVEGPTDKAVLEAAFASSGIDVHAHSIAVVSVDGKSKMDKPAIIFRSLGIPTYLVFDNDSSKGPAEKRPDINIFLQKLCGVEAPVEWPEGANDRFAAFRDDLEGCMKARVGSVEYEGILDVLAAEFGLSRKEIRKTPAALLAVFTKSSAKGVEFPEFGAIINRLTQF